MGLFWGKTNSSKSLKIKFFGIPLFYLKRRNKKIKLCLLFGLFSVKESKKHIRYCICSLPLFGITKKKNGRQVYKLMGIKLYRRKGKNVPDLPPLLYPEHLSVNRLTPIQLAKQLMKYDVVSFDIFDTLILRNVEQPVDIFSLVENRLEVPEFKTYRIQAEKDARNKKNSREVTIYEIYQELHKYIFTDIEKAINTELEVEEDFCFGNPYFRIVFDILKKNNKIIIAVSNMYLPHDIMKKLLKKCGFDGFHKIYVSCDYRVSKGGDALLYDIVKGDFPDKSIIHSGDNYRVDFVNAQSHNLDAYYYPNNTIASLAYRPKRCWSLSSSLHKAIVANTLYNGVKHDFDRFYSYGFIYGGILVYGFCQHLEQYCKENQIDKILFLARDGDIIQKVYNRFFGAVQNEYVLWSRFAGTQVNLQNSVEDLISRNVNPYFANSKGNKIKDLFEHINCSFLLDEADFNMDGDESITTDNIDYIKQFIRLSATKIKAHFEYVTKDAENYFYPIIQQSQNLCIVDVGWSGKGIICLRQYLKDRLQFKGTVKGCMIGAFDRDFTNLEIAYNKLNSWMFNAYKNRDLMDKFNQNIFNETIFFESLVTSAFPSFLGFGKDNTLDFAETLVENDCFIQQTHQGILDFTQIFHRYARSYSIDVQPNDAFSNIDHFASHQQWIDYIFGDFYFQRLTGYGHSNLHGKLTEFLEKQDK